VGKDSDCKSFGVGVLHRSAFRESGRFPPQYQFARHRLIADYDYWHFAGLVTLRRIDPNRRTPMQNYVLAELEAPERDAARARASVGNNRELFIQHERLILAIGININGTGHSGTAETAEIRQHPSYASLDMFKQMPEEVRAELNDVVDRQLASAGHAKFLR
jgi:hypothetical protein